METNQFICFENQLTGFYIGIAKDVTNSFTTVLIKYFGGLYGNMETKYLPIMHNPYTP